MPPKKGSHEEKGSPNEGDTPLGQNVENEAAAYLLATQRFREGQVTKRRRRASLLMEKDRSPEEDAELELLLKDLSFSIRSEARLRLLETCPSRNRWVARRNAAASFSTLTAVESNKALKRR